MNCIIPFESKVKFDGTVKEICSVSLEHDITKNEHEILGNFYVSGTYKEHELSVNTTDFNFVIPFSVDLTNRIELDTLEFSIDNFTYNLEDNEMTVLIDYIVTADDVREDVITEEIDIDPVDLIEEDKSVVTEVIKDVKKEMEQVVSDEREEISEEVVSTLETENDYMTYHIHIVKTEDTLDSIALLYKVSKDEIEKLNENMSMTINEKLIVPIINE